MTETSPNFDARLFRRSRVRLQRQTEIAECGIACIAMVANFHGMRTDLAALRARFSPSSRGAPLQGLIDVANEIGFLPRPVTVPLKDLRYLRCPAILHWDMCHYVVLERVKGDKCLIHDPARHSRTMMLAEVSDHFTGVALELMPRGSLEQTDNRQRMSLTSLWRTITGLHTALFQTLLLTLVMQAYVLALPYYTQIALDQVLPANDANLLTVLAFGFTMFLLINVGAGLLRSFVLLSAGSSFGFGVSNNIVSKLFRLPIAWFEKRHVGDILSRFQSIRPIQDLLINGAVATVIDGTMALLLLIMLFFYSAAMALIAVGAFGLYLLVRIVTFPVERRAQENAIITGGIEQTTMIESVRGIAALRLANRETMRQIAWQNRQTDKINAELKLRQIAIWQETVNLLIFGGEFIGGLYVGVSTVLNGGLTIGMLFAFLAYKTQFIGKGTALSDKFVLFRMLGLHLERLSDIALSEEDASYQTLSRAPTAMVGKIELRDVRFRYARGEPEVLSGVNLTVEAGEHIAITGTSGGGKSTLIKVLLGLIEPDTGLVLIDDRPLALFGHKCAHDQMAGVLQDDILFSGTLLDNITMFEPAPDMEAVFTAARQASVHETILRLPMQYNSFTGEMGSSLSGGQKQRVILARALYRKPRLLVMDEGTAHLDAKHEHAINEAIRALRVTRIIVAHRRETIEAADRVFEMADGRLEARG